MRSKFQRHVSGRPMIRLRDGAFAIGCMAALLACPAHATPGMPGTPQPATPIFIENFQNSNPANWIRLTAYAPDIPGTGSTPNLPPKPAGESYTADAPWLTSCNGMVLSFNSGGATPAECGASGWAYVRQLAQALGQVDGMTQAQARQNLAVAAFTQSNPGANQTQFRTSVEVPFAAPATRFVTFSVDAAAVSCFAAHPAFQFAIFSGAGAPIPVGSTLDPCAAGTPTRPVEAIGGNGADNINAARFTTDQSYPFTGTSLGVLMRNAQGSGGGNDAAFDNIRVYDATPQLDKSFTPSVVAVGDTSTLTLTITNTDERASKSGFSFTDALPAGLTIAAAPAPSNSCGGTVTAVAGGTSVTLAGGSLAAGAASCTVSVPVTAAALGLYANGPANITSSTGLNPPANATLAVLSTVGIGCPKVPIYTNTGEGALALQVWDPTDGTELGSMPLSESYGDIAITADGRAIYGARFTQTLPEGRTIDRIDPSTGAVIGSFVVTGDMATDDVTAINGLSVRSDGMLLAGSYLSSNIYVVDPATGASTRLGAGFPTDVVSAGDFVTLPDGDILALGVQLDTSVAVYRIKPDLSIFQVGTVGSTFGAAMSGGDLYLIGAAGELYRVESIPTTASTDVLPATLVVNTAQPFYGATSIQDAGDSVCHPAVLTLQKTWIGAQVGDAVSMQASIEGNLIDSMDSIVASPNQTTTDTTPITVYGGDVIDFSETFTAGSAAGYGSALTCSGNANPLVGDALTVGATDASIVCTYTNTGLGADLSITKTDGSATYIAGSPITYTIVASNAGPATANGATVVDAIPASIVNPTWTCTGAGGASCPASGVGDIHASVNLPVGGTATFTVVGTVSASASGDLVNTATIAVPAGMTDPVPGNDSATDTDVQGPQLTVAKSATPNPFVVGQPASYAIVVTNSGGAPTSAPITVADTLPAGITLTTASGANWACTGTTALACTFSGTLAAGASTALTLNVAVAASAANGDNTATASGGGDPGCPAATRCVGTVVVPLTPVADIAVLKTVDDATPNVGEQVTFTITASNLGPNDATGVAITDGLPFGMTLVSATPSAGTFDPASGLWTIGTLADGASQTLTLTVSIDVAGTLVNHAAVSASDQPDPDTSNNSAAAAVNAEPSADIGLLKTADDTLPNVGSDVTYTLTATNHGPSDATGIEITDHLPAGVSFASAVPSQGSYDSASGVWFVGALANGANATLTITVHVDQAGSITNIATITHEDQFDPNPANNSSGTTINGQSADLAVTKTVDDTAPTVGEQVTFTITVHNNGPSDATGVELTDQLPATLSFVSAAPSQGSYAAGTGLWTVGTLTAAGPTSTATLTITATVVDAGATTNTATVTGEDQPDPNPANNSDSASLNGNPLADLAVTKSGPATVTPGGDAVYTIVVSNRGPSAAINVVVADATPAGLVFVSNAGACTTAYPCSIGTLANGASATITTTYTVPAGYSGANPIVNTAVVRSDTPDPDSTNNQGSAQTNVGPGNADLAIVKEGPAAVASNGAIRYTLRITNHGPSPANGASYSDAVPAGITGITASCGEELGGAACVTQPTVTGNTVTGTVGTLPSSGSVVITIDGTAPQGPLTLSNAATVTPPSGVNDPDPGNNQDDVDTAVGAPTANLAAVKTGPAVVGTGGAIRYTVLVTNAGPGVADGALFSDPVPAGITGVTATCASPTGGAVCGAVGVAGNTVTSTIATLPAGGSVTFTIDGTAPANATGLTNTASVEPPSGTVDPDPSDNQDSVDTDVVETPTAADLAVVKTGPASVAAGSDAIYTIVVTNHGPDPALNVMVADPTPSGLVFVSNAGACATAYPCAIGTLASGASATITTTYAVPAAYAGPNPIANTASASSDTPDPNASNNSDTATTPLAGTPMADLVVTKTGPAGATAGQTIRYSIQVANHGPDAVPDAVLDDPTPAGLEYVSSTAPCAGGFPCALPPLANGASVNVTVTYLVQPGYSGAITNVATAQSPTVPDPSPETNSSTVSTPVTGNPGPVRPVPVDARWMLMLMGVLLMLAGVPFLRRRR